MGGLFGFFPVVLVGSQVVVQFVNTFFTLDLVLLQWVDYFYAIVITGLVFVVIVDLATD